MVDAGKALGGSTTRARTRRAILDAAVTVLSNDAAASLHDIAAAAGVGRTTVHRYFPERSDLVRALGHEALEKIGAATVRARLDEGPALQALQRLCQELFELGDLLMLIFSDPQLMTGEEWEVTSDADRALTRLIERGREGGEIDAAMDPDWVQHLLWALLYAAWMHGKAECVGKYDSLNLCLRSLRKALAAGKAA
ncbi:TetR/AcrR family transcriptional regulator [Saccharomonospora sp. NPDC046836]|uniref:TetR/AcrR family transcriptional regulator n=1 Tax=Saccharomonospora sp. NPDC046836 TaxID=3156921 RepID=UPI0033ED29AB